MSVVPWWNDENLLGDPEEIQNPNAQLALDDTSFQGPDVETDEEVLAQQVFTELADRAPGWTPHDGNLEVWLIEAFSRVAAQLRVELSNVPAAIFVTYGTEILGIPITPPAPALGSSDWTAEDDQGYTIPAGTQFTLARTGSEQVAFEVISSAEIPVGETTITGVPVRAMEDGAGGNGLSGAGDPVDPLAWVESISVPQQTFGGTDGQSQWQYLDELVGLLRVVALRPILPGDFAVLALRQTGGGRAVAMDGYDPASKTWGHQRTITLILTDPDGEPWPQQVMQGVRDYLEGLREVNWVVNVIAADYEPVNVTYEVVTFAEQDTEVVRAACQEALTNELSPATYRLGTTSPGVTAGEVIPPPGYIGEGATRRMIRRNDLIGLLDRTRGVDYVVDVQIDGSTNDLELQSATTLPRPGTIEGTVNGAGPVVA